MRVVIVQSRDSDEDFFERIRSAVEGQIAPLEVERRDVDFFYELPGALDRGADMNIVFLLPRKEYGPIAAEVFRLLVEAGAKVIFEWYENVPAAEEDLLKKAIALIVS